MPINYWPILITIALPVVPLVLLVCGARRKAWKAAVVSLVYIGLVFGSVFIPGWYLLSRAKAGDPRYQFRAARWCETYVEVLQNFVLWWASSDVEGGLAWLEKAAKQNYPPAVYALGVHLEYGPVNPEYSTMTISLEEWKQRRQVRSMELISRAIELGYVRTTKDEFYYQLVFRRWFGRDPNEFRVYPATKASADH